MKNYRNKAEKNGTISGSDYFSLGLIAFWGLAHVFTKDLGTGLLGLIVGFAMGGGYFLVNRDLKRAYGMLFLMFVL